MRIASTVVVSGVIFGILTDRLAYPDDPQYFNHTAKLLNDPSSPLNGIVWGIVGSIKPSVLTGIVIGTVSRTSVLELKAKLSAMQLFPWIASICIFTFVNANRAAVKEPTKSLKQWARIRYSNDSLFSGTIWLILGIIGWRLYITISTFQPSS